MMTFQKLILSLDKYWRNLGCTIVQPINLEIGAGTFHPITFFNVLKDNNAFFSYVQLCNRPNDSRYGLNINKLQQYYQFQVIVKPAVNNIQDLYIDSLKYLGIDLSICELRFVEDNWENPTLGAYGVGWEVLLNGIEITQFTYFQQMGGIKCQITSSEITYGLERLSLFLQNKNKIFDLIWNVNNLVTISYGDLFLKNEQQKSIYNLDLFDIKFIYFSFKSYKKECLRLLSKDKNLFIISYNLAIKVVSYFNLLDSRGCLSEFERQRLIIKIKSLFNKIALSYINS